MFLLLFACSVGVENSQDFSIAYAESQCRAYKQCNRSLFDGEYETMPECEDQVQKEFLEEINSQYEGCTYSSDKAQECLNLINRSTCGELHTDRTPIYEACRTDVWGCEG